MRWWYTYWGIHLVFIPQQLYWYLYLEHQDYQLFPSHHYSLPRSLQLLLQRPRKGPSPLSPSWWWRSCYSCQRCSWWRCRRRFRALEDLLPIVSAKSRHSAQKLQHQRDCPAIKYGVKRRSICTRNLTKSGLPEALQAWRVSFIIDNIFKYVWIIITVYKIILVDLLFRRVMVSIKIWINKRYDV